MIQPITIKNPKLGERKIGPGNPPFIVAEACVNHEGKIEIARDLVKKAKKAGADCVKFQIHVLQEEMLREGVPMSDNMPKSLWEILDETNLTIEEHKELKALCEELGMWYLCTPFNSRTAVDILDKQIGVDFFKVGSGELTNLPFIEYIAKKGKPMIVSTGMSKLEEVKETVDLIKSIGTPFIITHCTSAYPCPYEIVNLNLIPKYMQEFQVPVGLSDHTKTIYTAIGSIALGACLIEKHFTYDKTAIGIDHASSIEPPELTELVKGCQAVYKAIGKPERKIQEQEKQIVAWARESVVSEQNIPVGTVITEDMIWAKRPSPKDSEIPARDYKKVIGKKAKIDIKKNTKLKWDDLE
jgi:N-acetylneuraminate synthase